MIYVGWSNNEIKLFATDPEAVQDGAVALGITLDSVEATDEEVVTAWDGKMYFKGEEPARPLDELKVEKREEINAARDSEEQGGFEYLGKIFDSDQISCLRMSCAAQAMALMPVAEPEPTITWTCQDNSTIDLTPAEMQGLVSALAQWSNSCHEKATALKTLIEQAESEEDLEKISWDMSLDSSESETEETTGEEVDGLL